MCLCWNKYRQVQVLVCLLSFSAIASAGKVVPEDVLNEWGYQSSAKYRYDVTYCYSRTFAPDFARVQSNRDREIVFDGIDEREISIQGVGQYTIIRERFKTSGQAKNRWTIMHQNHGRSSRYEKSCLLREAFLFENDIYIIARVSLFDEGWMDLMQRLKVFIGEPGDSRPITR